MAVKDSMHHNYEFSFQLKDLCIASDFEASTVCACKYVHGVHVFSIHFIT